MNKVFNKIKQYQNEHSDQPFIFEQIVPYTMKLNKDVRKGGNNIRNKSTIKKMDLVKMDLYTSKRQLQREKEKLDVIYDYSELLRLPQIPTKQTKQKPKILNKSVDIKSKENVYLIYQLDNPNMYDSSPYLQEQLITTRNQKRQKSGQKQLSQLPDFDFLKKFSPRFKQIEYEIYQLKQQQLQESHQRFGQS